MNRTFVRSISDIPSLGFLLQRCSSMDELKQIHAHAITNGLARFAFISSKLLSFSAISDYGELGYAETLFNQIPTPSVFDFNSMIMGFSKNSQFEKGLLAYAKMRSFGTEPSARTFPVLVKACSASLNFLGQVHGQIIKFGHGSDVYVVSSLISAYSKCGTMQFARRVFDERIEKNVVCWTSLLSGYFNNGLVDEAQDLFDEMPKRNDVSYSAMVSGYVWNGHFYEAIMLFRELKKSRSNVNCKKGSLLVSVLNACASVGAFEDGKWIHFFLVQNGFEYELELGTALIDFYAKCGCIRDAKDVFSRMPHKDVTTWSAMITGLAGNGENKLGLELFAEMEKKGPKPNAVTFIGVLTACNHKTLVHKAWRYFGLMSKVYGIFPVIEHYGCMVDLLARLGRLKQAEILISTMPMEPDGAIWGSLLNGYIMHDDVELGETVGRLLIQMEPTHSGRYVLLANMYAAMGSWEDVMRLRKMMEEREVVKISAWSFIEIDGVVHKFVADDKSHPRLRGIYRVLDQLKRELRSSFIINNLITV